MTVLLNHDYEVVIGETSGLSQSVFITQHHSEFKVTKEAADGIKLKLKIYNLNEEETLQIMNFGSTASVFLSAGYLSDTTNSIFKGNATEVFSRNKDGESILSISADASHLVIDNAWSDISLPPKPNVVTRRSVLNTLIGDLGTEARSSEDALDVSTQLLDIQGKRMDDTFDTGYNFSGPTLQGIHELLSPINYDWFIEDGQFYCQPPTTELSVLEVPLLSPSTGLYSVERRGNAADDSVKYILTCALMNKAKLGGVVKVEDDDLEGTFKINKIITTGEFIGDMWDTVLEVAEPKQED